MGSKMAVNRVKDDKQTIVIETFEAFIAPKKSIQCRPNNKPVANSLSVDFKSALSDIFLKTQNKPNDTPAINTLYQTNWYWLILINAPKMAVNPQTKTV